MDGSPFINASSFQFRDPAQHSALKQEIEEQSTAYYATARLWDDGIILPMETRDTLGLGLAISYRSLQGNRRGQSWDGEDRGMGVFRM